SDGISHLLDSLLRIVSWEQPPVEHDSALALNRVCGLGKTLDGVRCQTDLAQLRMSLLFRVRHQGFEFFKDFHRTFNGADTFPRPAAVRLLATHDHQHIDTSFVPELNFRRTVDDAPIGFYVPVIEHMSERIVAPGFAGGADDEIKIPRQFNLVDTNESHRRHHRRQTALLLAGPTTPNTLALQFVWHSVADFACIGILHRAWRRVHRIADEHESIGAPSTVEPKDEITLVINRRMQPSLLELGFYHLTDQGKHLRLGLQLFGLRACVLNQLDDKSFDLVILKILIDDSVCGLCFHAGISYCNSLRVTLRVEAIGLGRVQFVQIVLNGLNALDVLNCLR